MVVAIDGPAGAGKSTVAKIVANRVDIEYVDSGAIYRAITKKMLDSNIKIEDYSKIEELLKDINISLLNGKIFINGEDLTPFLRTKEVTELVSPVSNNVAIRHKVNEFLNEYSKNKSIIMDGRDIGTVVFPNADFKIYLDASLEKRSQRRFLEKTTNMSLDDIAHSIKKRDDNDKNKSFGALKVASDAIYLDTTDLSVDEVVDNILKIIKYNGVKV
ncbi:MAG: cytidylate kinase [Spirochaetes bacterium GWD1_27_9]|nr:MAG: cytidylate kinase [Spirochaetes bacterium GWB1_27_13]OHD22239.1 MAG: cytidylate kinase [Spirochaetes bacterium GWC1_27_15]OHD44806.1 MAG: cytidylate kinase [Spirochaetes bacterium GWD1_27_9]